MNDPSTALSTSSPAAGSQTVAAALERLERRLDRIEATLARVTALADRAPPVLAALADTADDVARRAADRGVDLDARLRATLALAERLSAPETAALVERALDAAAAAPAAIATVADTVDGLVARAGDAGIDVEERLRVLAGIAERLTSPTALATVREVLGHLDVVERLLGSGVLAQAPVAVVERAALSLAATCGEPAAPVSPWAVLRALGDPGVQHALSFALRFAKRFGESLPADAPAPRLPPNRGAA